MVVPLSEACLEDSTMQPTSRFYQKDSACAARAEIQSCEPDTLKDEICDAFLPPSTRLSIYHPRVELTMHLWRGGGGDTAASRLGVTWRILHLCYCSRQTLCPHVIELGTWGTGGEMTH